MRNLFVVLMFLAPLAPAASPGAAQTHLLSAGTPPAVRVAVANAREGSFLRSRDDLDDPTDRRLLARRLLSHGRLPDVVLLQEVLGSAGRLASALTHDPQAEREGVSYRVITSTSVAWETGACDGSRSGRFPVLRSSAILASSATVAQVLDTGTVRTWGRWHRRAWGETLPRGYGCAAHPWARLTVSGPDGATRTVLVLDAHVSPSDGRLKQRAVRVMAQALGERATTDDLVVLGGDFNLSRCRPIHDPEPRRCRARPAHRALLDAGFSDAVRAVHPDGPVGTMGLARRVDFLYTTGQPVAAWHDRCYRGFLVRRWWECSSRAEEFARQSPFHRCVTRSTEYGRPGAGCPSRRYRDFYSDHPALVATLA